MLYCNDEYADVRKKEYEWLKTELKEIQKMPNPVRILATQKIEKNPTGIFETLSAHAWPLRSVKQTKDGVMETWVYSQYAPKVVDDELKFTDRSFVIRDGSLILDVNKETEKIWYIINKSGLLESGLYRLEDTAKEDTEYVNEIAKDIEVKFYLTAKTSPIYNDHNKLKTLAASWGLVGSEQMHIDTLRKNLLNTVLSSERNYNSTKRGIKEFVAEVNGEDPFSEYRAVLQLAIDNKIIGFNDREKAWYILNIQTGDFAEHIVNVGALHLSQKNQILFEYIRQNASLFVELKNLLPTDVQKVEKPVFGTETRGRTEMRQKARELGINQKHKTDMQIWQEIDEKEKQLQTA